MAEDKLEIITVKAAREDGRVALFEQHPGNVSETNKLGEVYVVGDGKAHKVAWMPTVEWKLREGDLVEVTAIHALEDTVKATFTGKPKKDYSQES